MPRAAHVLILGAGLAAAGAALYYATRRDRRAPELTVEEARRQGEGAVNVALTSCAERTFELNNASVQFDADLRAMAPADALARLHATIAELCPEARGVPGVTRPEEPPVVQPPGPRPPPGGAPPLPPGADALALLIRDAGTAICSRPDLVTAFQEAANREAAREILAVSGDYDFSTAVAVQVRLTAKSAGIAPPLCAFPSFEAADAEQALDIVDYYRNELSELYSEVQ